MTELSRTGCLRESKLNPRVWPHLARSAARLRSIGGMAGLKPWAPCDWTKHYRLLDQGESNSCMGFSKAQCINVWCGIRGMTGMLVNPYRPYWYARALRKTTNSDGGVFPSDFWSANDKFNDVLCADLNALDAQRQVFVPPSAIDDLQSQGGKFGVEVTMRPIYATGDALLRRIDDSLALGFPCQVAFVIDDAFMDRDGPEVVDEARDAEDMLHGVAIIGTRKSTLGRSRPEYLLGNSWGEWRKHGLVWVTAERLAQSECAGSVEEVKMAA